MIDLTYPVLTHFLKAYLHQDWSCEYADDLEALNDLVDGDGEGPELVMEIDRALTIPEPELYGSVYALCSYRFGDSAHDWLEKLRAHLLVRLGGGGLGTDAAGSPPPLT